MNSISTHAQILIRSNNAFCGTPNAFLCMVHKLDKPVLQACSGPASPLHFPLDNSILQLENEEKRLSTKASKSNME